MFSAHTFQVLSAFQRAGDANGSNDRPTKSRDRLYEEEEEDD